MKHREFLNDTWLNEGYSAKSVLWEYFYLGGGKGEREREGGGNFSFLQYYQSLMYVQVDRVKKLLKHF